MTSSFDFPELDVLTTGTIGPPGQRVFYLQARHGDHVISLRLEKEQVSAMAEYLEGMLSDLSAADPDRFPADLELHEPVVPEWVVGSLAVAYDDQADVMVIVAEELAAEEDQETAVARFRATREQVAAFVERAHEVVEAGRPPCRFCGRPLDPEGHVCAKANGHRAR